MKSNLFQVFGVLLMLLFVFSCGKDDPTPPATQTCNTTGTFSFKLNGVQWEAVSFNNTLIVANDPNTGVSARRCDIRATNADGDQMILTFNNPNQTDANCMETGDYVSTANVVSSSSNVFFFTFMGTSGFASYDGTLNISSCDAGNDKQITGTFTFSDLIQQNSGTDGTFSVCFP